jgi:hypothetical protein
VYVAGFLHIAERRYEQRARITHGFYQGRYHSLYTASYGTKRLIRRVHQYDITTQYA